MRHTQDLLKTCGTVALIAGAIFGAEGAAFAQAGKSNGDAVTNAQAVVLFDGTAMTTRRARRMARASGDTFLAFTSCAGSVPGALNGCIDLSVESRSGKRFDYRISDVKCEDRTFQNRKGATSSLATSTSGVGKALNADARCYAGYSVSFRIRHDATTDERNNGMSIYGSSTIQVPAIVGDKKWINTGGLNSSATWSRMDSLAKVDWRVEATNGAGEVLSAENGSDALVSGKQNTPLRTSRRFATGDVSDAEKCDIRAETIKSGFDLAVRDPIYGLCVGTSLGVGTIDFGYTPSAEEGGFYVNASSTSMCGMLGDYYDGFGELAAQGYFDHCINEIPDDPTPPDEPPVIPDVPPGGDDPAEAICPEVSNVPSVTTFTSQENGVTYYCEVMTQQVCEVDEEMNSCVCENEAIGTPTCVGIEESQEWIPIP